MTPINSENLLNELEKYHTDLKTFKSHQERLVNEKTTLGHWYRERDELRERLVRTTGGLKQKIVELTGKQDFVLGKIKYESWGEAFNPTTEIPSIATLHAIAFCINITDEAIGRLESDIKNKLRDKQGNLVENLVTITGQKHPIKSPVQLFDSMQFHPKVVEVSRKLFEDEHYRDAIYRAFVEVDNFVKNKAKIQLNGKDLMSKVFRLDNPIIKLNPLKTQSDRDEQEGFMLLYMGAMEGIRNPKAHENTIQYDPYRSLKYLSLASLLMETIDF
ncbi:MAG: TIGR02391 family protein [Dehalococcoidales bacterium]|nr:TIGR02391 family protein [Dehalococcoidales bacterium]